MTSGAVFRSGLVEQHALSLNDSHFLVASLTAHVLMCSPQGERCVFVIEKRGLPFRWVVAVGAGGDSAFGKLLAVGVLMALLAFRRSRLEVHVHQLRLKVRRFMAVNTSRCPMRTQQRKRCLGVVKTR